MKAAALALAGLLLAGAAEAAQSAPAAPPPVRPGTTPPAPTHWVTDNAGFLSPGVREELDARLREYQARTGYQVLAWIGSSTGGERIEDFAVRAFAAWRVGRKGIDDGLAIFLFAEDRTLRFEVGYGLGAVVPDAVASRIIQEVMAPRLKAGDRDGAVLHGVEATLAVIDGQPWSKVIEAQAPTGTNLGAGAPPAPPEEAPGATRGAPYPPAGAVRHGLLYTIVKWILIVAVLLFLITHPSFALWLLLNIFSGRGGGGFGGGGGGGFSGGGGRSGGGGASGSW